MSFQPHADDPISRAAVEDTLAALHKLLAHVQTGELTADSGTIARLEGAALALQALLRPERAELDPHQAHLPPTDDVLPPPTTDRSPSS